MKNNLLTEIKNIKNLMGLNEDSNDDCESQLEKAGYVVFSKTEQRGSVSACAGKERIMCVKKWMDDNGVDDNLIKVGSFKSVCYLMGKSSKKITMEGQELSDITWIFWENGDITFIDTFSEVQVPDDTKPHEKFGQVRFQGKYTCDGSNIGYENLLYTGVYNVNDYGKLNKRKSFVSTTNDKQIDSIQITNNPKISKTDLEL